MHNSNIRVLQGIESSLIVGLFTKVNTIPLWFKLSCWEFSPGNAFDLCRGYINVVTGHVALWCRWKAPHYPTSVQTVLLIMLRIICNHHQFEPQKIWHLPIFLRYATTYFRCTVPHRNVFFINFSYGYHFPTFADKYHSLSV